MKNDLISRTEAVEEVSKALKGTFVEYEDIAEKIINKVPSAQPEIIHCKDCKFYGRADKRRFYRGSDCLNKRIDTIVPDRDFCSRAERRGEA